MIEIRQDSHSPGVSMLVGTHQEIDDFKDSTIYSGLICHHFEEDGVELCGAIFDTAKLDQFQPVVDDFNAK